MKRFTIAALAFAALAATPPAYAQTATVSVDCPRITFSFSGFPATGTTTATLNTSIDGAPPAGGMLTFSGSSFTRTFTLVGSGVAPGTHTITGTIDTTSTAGPPTSTPVSLTYVCVAAPAAEPARLPPPPARGAYCLAGRFLDLQLGQPALDPRYAGATPAFYYQGIGLTCDPLPAGYVLTGGLVNSSGLDIGAIDPGRIYAYARRP